MQQLIEQLAEDTGISVHEASLVVATISSQLINKIPALKQVIDDVLENVETDTLKEHITEMVILLQQQEGADIFKTWIMPVQIGRINRAGSDTTF